MKRIFLTLFIVISTVAISFCQEAGVGGVHRGGTSPEMKQQMKQRLKEQLKLTNDQADEVAVIQQDFQLKMRSVKMDSNTTEEDKKTQLKALEAERRQKLKATLTDKQIAKLDAFTQNMKRMKVQQAQKEAGQ